MKKSPMTNAAMNKLKVGVVGATGMVGEVFLRLLIERRFPIGELRLFASDRSVGQTRPFKGWDIPVQAPSEAGFTDLDLVFFSSGEEVSKQWAPRAVAAGAMAVDNSAAFRLDEKVALVVPEVNAAALPRRDQPTIIANPNCSTIQLVMALKPLAECFGLEQVRVASYQAVSGAGRAAVEALHSQNQRLTPMLRDVPMAQTLEASQIDLPPAAALPTVIAYNCTPQIGGFGDDGFCSEERKIRLETRKIMALPDLKISAWTVRVPAFNAHSEAVWVTLKSTAERRDLLTALNAQSGLKVYAEPTEYQTALLAAGTDPVYVSRIHQDPDDPRTWLMWVVADNLRKGAALNGIQIAEKVFGLPDPAL